MGAEVSVEGLTKSFGSQRIWENVTLSLPPGEVSVLLGPSGTGKSVFLKSLIGLLRPEQGAIYIDGTNIMECSSKELYEIRKLFGVMFQDGALFGSMNLYDNTAFPLREHTKKKESEIRDIVMQKLDVVGLTGHETKFPGEISGGMRKRAGLARSLVLDPQIILCDEPDSGLDPVRTAYLSQLLIDINAQIDATILIVTHNINIARTVPDNMGMLYRRNLVMFGPREVLLTSDEPVIKQFLNGRRIGPIGMSEEKDEATMAEEQAHLDAGHHDGGVEEIEGVPPQIQATPVCPSVRRSAAARRACARSCTSCPRTRRPRSRTASPEPTSTGCTTSATSPPVSPRRRWRRRKPSSPRRASTRVTTTPRRGRSRPYGGSDVPVEQGLMFANTRYQIGVSPVDAHGSGADYDSRDEDDVLPYLRAVVRHGRNRRGRHAALATSR
ncbi:ABC transporter family protein [Mycobacteroides abscessus subsp. bolletii 1513]|uniref:ABC transporter family protein n=1 Tax=Mycobacteroides abscessus subsp. bolletii 1513 TaxID=1299321 RepID=X8DHD5_9MYCO|nr:ABC transporter family protein [Mycobacteroides abscessus subsp. bolletii 1513]